MAAQASPCMGSFTVNPIATQWPRGGR